MPTDFTLLSQHRNRTRNLNYFFFTVGHNSFLGINSAVKEDVMIGTHNIIGAGVFINKNTEDYAIITNATSPQRIGDSKRFVMFTKTQEPKPVS